MTGFHLAQVNVGRLLAPIGDPRIDAFRQALDRINAIADAQAGFVWRLTGAGNNATDIQPDTDDPLQAINASAWESVEQLAAFAYRTEHREFVRRRAEWFEAASQPILALWWVPAGHTPGVAECLARLAALRAQGPTPFAFDFRQRFEAPAAEAAA